VAHRFHEFLDAGALRGRHRVSRVPQVANEPTRRTLKLRRRRSRLDRRHPERRGRRTSQRARIIAVATGKDTPADLTAAGADTALDSLTDTAAVFAAIYGRTT
jgi:hypothetical protein